MTKKTAPMFGSVTVGADPEILLVNSQGVPHGALQCSTGTKESPEECNKGAIQVDGMALEFNILPANNPNEFVENINTVLDECESRAADQSLRITDSSILDYARYINEHGATEDELLFGCDPDYNCYTGSENEMPDNDGSITVRTAGGHVHVGFSYWDKESYKGIVPDLVRVCDLFLGINSVLTDNGKERKQMYGKAGAYRVKSYGFEYRTLSNYWIFDEDLTKAIAETMIKVFSLDRVSLKSLVDFAKNWEEDIVFAINEDDSKVARMVAEHRDAFVDSLF